MDQSETTWLYGPMRNRFSTGRAAPFEEKLIQDNFTVKLDPDALPGWECRDNLFTMMEEIYEITERKMTPHERAAFKAAKMKELQSFFENDVWAFAEDADPTRSLKARFLLKRREGPAGPEAQRRVS